MRGASGVHALPTARWFGVYPAVVTSHQDPDGIGRVRVRLPWAPDAGGPPGASQAFEARARLASLSAGRDRGGVVPAPT
ncbi:MAG: phage baseplate assembly protein V [Vicinamibacterales bacterium]